MKKYNKFLSRIDKSYKTELALNLKVSKIEYSKTLSLLSLAITLHSLIQIYPIKLVGFQLWNLFAVETL